MKNKYLTKVTYLATPPELVRKLTKVKTNMPNQQESKHTPTPFSYGGKTIIGIRNKIAYKIASVEREIDAEFIVRSVNSHEELLKAAKHCLQFLDQKSK